jgi:hypothetical protein
MLIMKKWFNRSGIVSLLLSLSCAVVWAEEDLSVEVRILPADREHWAFQPLAMPPSPAAALEDGQAAHPIDRFIDAKPGASGLMANGPASRRDLIRRATFGLIGLPPTPGEIFA